MNESEQAEEVELTSPQYLCELAGRLFDLPAVHGGTDQYDCERLEEIAKEIVAGQVAVPILARVLYFDDEMCKAIEEERYIGTTDDCWNVCDPVDYPAEIKEEIRTLCLRVAQGEKDVWTEAVVNNGVDVHFHIRVWSLLEPGLRDERDGCLPP